MEEPSFYKQNTLPELTAGDDTPTLPSQIGPYRIEGLLSKGGMSLLYLGIDPKSKKPLVVKVLSPTYVTHPEAIAHFLKEAKVIALTNHPNIVKLYGQGEWEGGLYTAMEFIRGISLRQFILQHSLSLNRALEIVLQVAFALSHLHAHGVIHRDLKPENILITEEGEIKVIDFGIAQLRDENHPTGSLSKYMGTPGYISPEQKQDPSSVTCATDIYALGVILYELVIGDLSFGTIHLSAMPKKLKKIAAKALAVSLEKRYQSSADLIHDISLYLQSGTLEKERTGKDRVQELYEKLQQASRQLLPTVPTWPQIDLGLGKRHLLRAAQENAAASFGLYYDFFRLPDNTFLVLMACTPVSVVESALAIALLRGMIRMHIHTWMHEWSAAAKGVFPLSDFVSQLNQFLHEDPMHPHFDVGCVLLDPANDLATYLSCGLSPLLHIPQAEHTVRSLLAQNDPLGATAVAELAVTSDNWNPGDTLLLHTFRLKPQATPAEHAQLDTALRAAVQESRLFSAQQLAETVAQKLNPLELPRSLAPTQALIAIQRVF